MDDKIGKKIQNKNYYEANKERILAKRKADYERDKEIIKNLKKSKAHLEKEQLKTFKKFFKMFSVNFPTV